MARAYLTLWNPFTHGRECVVENRALANREDGAQLTPLRVAATSIRQNSACYLLDKGAKMTTTDSHGQN